MGNGPPQTSAGGPGSAEDSSGGDPHWRGYYNPLQGRTINNRGDWAGNVINMLKVPGVHQVMLRVKIAELDRTAARNSCEIFPRTSSSTTARFCCNRY